MNSKLVNRLTKIAYSMYPTIRTMRTSHIAFILKSYKIIKIGWNKPKTHPATLNHPYHPGRVHTHSEMDVINKMGKSSNLNNHTLVVLRIDRNGKLTNSKPCKGCQGVIKQKHIKNVWYSNSSGNVVEF